MHNFNKTLIIVPCGKKKVWDINPTAGKIKAKDAYISNYFKLCKQYAERFADEWVILSGKYGIIEPDSIISGNYDTKLFVSKKFEDKVKRQLQFVVKNISQVISLCGNYYSLFLKDVLYRFDLPIYVPLQGSKIGERQKLLKKCLKENKPLKIDLHKNILFTAKQTST